MTLATSIRTLVLLPLVAFGSATMQAAAATPTTSQVMVVAQNATPASTSTTPTNPNTPEQPRSRHLVRYIGLLLVIVVIALYIIQRRRKQTGR